MTVPVREITQERLAEWQQGVIAAHATPVILVAVGHDHRAGELHVFVPDDVPGDELAAVLLGVVQQLVRGQP